MKDSSAVKIILAGLALFAGAALSQAASSANGTWITNASGNWSGTSNWSGGVVANGSTEIADFSTIVITANRTVTLDSSRTIGTLRFGNMNGVSSWFLNSSGGSSLTISGTSPLILVSNNTATLTLPVVGNNNWTKTGVGTLVLAGTNTFSGAVTVSAGTLVFAGLGGSPATTATLVLANTTNTPAILDILPGANVTNYSLGLGENVTGSGAVYQSGGTYTLARPANIAVFRIGDATSAYGYYQLSGGTLNVNEVGVGGGNPGTNTVGVMDITGGTFNDTGWITVGRGAGTSSGVLNVSGSGSVLLAGSVGGSKIGIDWAGTAGGSSMINLFNGGSITGPASTSYVLDLGSVNTAGTYGIVNLNSGGTLAIGGVTASTASPTSLLDFNGGTLKATTANAAFMVNGNIHGVYVYGGGAVIDDGGFAITISDPLLSPGGYGVSSIPVTGGGSGYIAPPFVSIAGGSGFGATATAQINTNNGHVTNILVTCPGTGYTSGDALNLTVTLTGGGGNGGGGGILGTPVLTANSSGGLTKLGAGTLTLSGANTYTGGTTVSNGTLFFNGSIPNGVIVASGGTLGGNGIIGGAVTNQAGGTLQPGLGGTDTSTLTINNNLTLAGSTVFALNTTNAQTAGKIAGIGTLTEGGTLTVNNTGPPLAAGDTFILFSASNYAGSFSTINLPGLASGLFWTNTVAVNGTIMVISTNVAGSPILTTLPASSVLANSAVLNGQVLSTGGQTPNVTVYYGTADGGTNAGAWASSVALGPKSAAFFAQVSSLVTNTTYYFTAYASNSTGVGWVTPSLSFTTLASDPVITRVQMLTYHNDNTRQGLNPNETLLTPANVRVATFGKLFSYALDGYIYTEPLIMTNLTIPGQGVHDVVFVASEHDTVYALDADSNAGANGGVLWTNNLGNYALSASGAFGYRYSGGAYPDIVPDVGITGTPVIDPVSGTLYVNAFTHEGSSYIHRIHALDVTTGLERSYSPVVVTGSVPGTGRDSSGGVMTFNPLQSNQRGALTLANGIVYVTYAGYADTDPYHGWVMGYYASNLAPVPNSVFCSTPNATTAAFGANAAEGGVWMGGNGLCVDSNNNLYFHTGNGSFSQVTNGGDYADSLMKLSTTNGLSVLDYFTPADQAHLASADLDLAACGPMLVPAEASSTNHPNLIVSVGKEGTIYLIDQTNLGQYNGVNNAQIVQSVGGQLSTIWSSPVYFNHLVYFQASSSVMRSFSLNNGVMGSTPASAATIGFGQYNGGPVISANGTNNGIAWAINGASFGSGGADVLYAFNATNLSQMLYNTTQNPARDNPGGAMKMTTPTVAGGKVYVGAEYQLSVYGVQVFLDTPVIAPNGGPFTNSVQVSLTDGSPGVNIYYTLDGSTPTTGSTLYTAPFLLTSNAVVSAIATQPGAVNSGVAGASFVNTAALGNGTGLLGQYYTNTLPGNPFVGSPLVRTDAVVNFNWSVSPPFAGMATSNYTVKWTGSIQPQFNETYTLTTVSDDGVRLYVNGQLLINDWVDQAGTNSVSLPLAAQQLYSIEMDYYQHTGNAVAELEWSSPSTTQRVVPQTQLYPYTNPAPTVMLMSPSNNATYTGTASVTINAEADAPYNPISGVSFYANSNLLGTVGNAPYTLTATGLGAGSYALKAVATDGSGLAGTSGVVNLTVSGGSGAAYGLTTNGTVPAFFNLPTTFAGSLPLLLSQTGVFSNTPAMAPVGGLIPYVPNTPLWSDGALKTRYLAVPNNGGAITPGEQIVFAPTGTWTFPAGTVFVKTFSLNTDVNNPGVIHRLETRLLVRDVNGQVYGVTYKWRADNSEADLLTNSLTENIVITNGANTTLQTWYYPSPSDCLACHAGVNNDYVLGVNSRQLNGTNTYAATGVTDNQLRTLNRLGLLNPAIDEGAISNYEKLSALTNLAVSAQERSRSYLDANCAQCHQPGGTGISFDARYDTALTNQDLINYPASVSLGYDHARIIAPSDVWRSVIWDRVNVVDGTNAIKIQMPPLARNVIDTNAVAVLAAWINGLGGVPAEAPPVLTPNGGNFVGLVNVGASAPDTNAVIYYTLDGSLPTTNSLKYTGPVELTNGAVTVSANAWAAGHTNSVATGVLFVVQPLYFASAGVTNQSFTLQLVGAAGSNYVLLATTNFTTWVPVATNTAVSNVLILRDSGSSNFPKRFYRVMSQ